jgi:hypothetical protein
VVSSVKIAGKEGAGGERVSVSLQRGWFTDSSREACGGVEVVPSSTRAYCHYRGKTSLRAESCLRSTLGLNPSATSSMLDTTMTSPPRIQPLSSSSSTSEKVHRQLNDFLENVRARGGTDGAVLAQLEKLGQALKAESREAK